MSPTVHALVSISVGTLIWQAFQSWQAGLASALAGFFVDLDHILDYVIAGRRSWRIKKFLHFYQQFKEPYVFVPFHAWEAIVLLLSLAWLGIYPNWLIGIAIGLTHHLILDQLANGMRWPAYFLCYRLLIRFKSNKILKELYTN